MNLITLFKNTFELPDTVDKEESATYSALITGAWCGLFIHIGLLSLFYICDIQLLWIINIVSVLIWILVIYLFTQGDLVNGLYLCCIEIAGHAIIAVSVLGTIYGFQYYVISVACMLTIDPRLKLRSGLVMGVFCLLLFVLIHLLYDAKTSVEFFNGYETYIFSAVFMSGLTPLLLGIYAMKKEYLLQRSKLEKIANYDMLTGLHNRRFFYTFLGIQGALAKKQKTQFCVALGDIDKFKRINDTYGHDAGDEVLVSVSNLLSEQFSEDDGVCRWGGEEFIVFIPLSNIEHAYNRIEKIRKLLSETPQLSNKLTVTMSFGIVQVKPNEEIDDFIKRADVLLYKAKENGRNRSEYK